MASTVVVVSIHSSLAKSQKCAKIQSVDTPLPEVNQLMPEPEVEFNNKIHNKDMLHVALVVVFGLFGMTCAGLTLVNVEDCIFEVTPIKAVIYILQDMGVYFPSVISCCSVFLTNPELKAYSIDLLKTGKL